MTASDHLKQQILGPCCECGSPCTERDLIGNGMDADGLGSWPKLWCDKCINKHRTGSLGGDQIPEDLKELYESSAVFDGILLHDFCNDHNLPVSPKMEHTIRQYLIERIAKAEAALAQKTRECEEAKRGPCCKEPGYCDGDCTCEICAPDLAIRDLKAQVEQLERQVAELKEEGNG